MHFVKIPARELTFHADRGSGPGGQHKNKKNTRVRLLWDFESSSVLSDVQRAILRSKLRARLNESGLLEMVAGEERSRSANLEAALSRMEELVRKALIPRKRRIRTRVPGQEKEKRITAKKRRSRIKKDRSAGRFSGDD